MINQNILDELKASRDLKRMTSKNITIERYRAKTKLLEDANSELQESLDVANTEIACLENKISEWQENSKYTDYKIEDLENEIDELKVELNNANSIINDLENDVS